MNPEKRRKRAKVKAKRNSILRNPCMPYFYRTERGAIQITKKGWRSLGL